MIRIVAGVMILLFTIAISFAKENTMSQTAPKVKLTTSLGIVILQLDAEKAPITVKNFLQYVNDGFYNKTVFHRVIPNFMAQGGGFESGLQQKTTHEPIQNEADNGLKNNRGTIAMARTNDPHSATAQFFINFKDNGFLNFSGKNASGWGYAVFGEVIEGMDVIDEMGRQPTGTKGYYQDVPQTDIVIETAELLD